MFIEYRRRERKAALERFAQRRMRRKFKLHAMTDGVEDWKDFYHKQALSATSRPREDEETVAVDSKPNGRVGFNDEDERRTSRRRQRRKDRELLLNKGTDSEEEEVGNEMKRKHRRPKSKKR